MIISNRTVTTDPAIAGLGSPTTIIRQLIQHQQYWEIVTLQIIAQYYRI